ncbi:MAG: chromosome segregation protein SMC [Deltaproteobacteria bacterium]|nr:chromosome segregation protein SMC [Deltaproteobacteria bacterium]
MKLKRLELNGFKSFSEKTIVSFPKGISGVVGPNGCGKSNIVDAIKWVMGEQSPKQLRGKGMDDVIFSGSNGKSSVGMAEVSLVLDNDNGSIPPEYADFSEVVITRRLFRDGESEYAINNKACRLKDITHLFMDTGVGSKAYSVIEQGRIGAIIDSKPEDRRHWIEEAAGISKYKSKKNETLRKLELTEQNLLRVGDVIAEIKRQMNSLYRQAKKAERFKEIRKQSKEVELVLLAKEYQILLEGKGFKEEELRRQQEQAGEYRDECQSREDSLDQLQSELLGLERQLKEKQEQYYRQKADLQSQETRIQQYQKELENLGNEALEIEKEVSEIEQWLRENETREKILSEEVSSFTQTLSLEEGRVREKEQSLSDSKKSLTRCQEEGEQIKDILVTKLTELTRVRNMRVGLVKLQEDRQRRIFRQGEEKAQLTARLDFLKASVQETEARLAAQREALREFKAKIAKAQDQKTEIEKIRKSREEEFLDLEQGWKQDQAQIRNLQEIRDNFQSYQNGVRALLQADWPEEVRDYPAFRQVLVEGLETEPGCETAVETALGEALQALMIHDPSVALQGIDYLKDRGQGRASFLTLKPFGSSEDFSFGPWEGKGLVPLLSKVSAQEEFQTWLNLLLGPFVLVSDLKQGLEVWKNNPGQVCVVTLGGDLIDSRGIISGGSSRNPESGLLFQKNLIHKLELKVGEWREKIDRKKEGILTLETDLAYQINMIKDLENRKEEEEAVILDLEKRLIGYQEETKPIQRRLQLLILEEDEYRTQEEDQASEEKALSLQEGILNKEIEDLRINIREREEKTRILEADLEQERQTLTLAYTQLSALKEKGEHIGGEWERLKESLHEKQTRQKRLLEKIQTGKEIQAELIEKASSGEALVKDLGDQVRDFEVQIQAANQTWEKGIKQKEDLETALKETRGLLKESEQQENEIRMELAQMVMKIEQLKEQTLEQSGLPPEEVVITYLKGDEDLEALRAKRREFREKLEQLGEVNLTALEEYNAFKERYDFYHTQEEDLLKSMDSLKRAIQKINFTSKELFLSTFKIIQEKMNEVFPMLFGGGTAKLSLTDEEDPLESGVEIMVHPPGKRVTSMTLLSGGEKALTALALLFSTYLVKPSPFCLLDEIDAFLDEANVERFKGLVRNIVRDSQIILITHNRRIMEMADTLYGVTMEQPGISKLVSVRLDTLQ